MLGLVSVFSFHVCNVDLIDLTGESPSDPDDLPLPEVSLSSTYDRYVKLYVYVYIVSTSVRHIKGYWPHNMHSVQIFL